MWSRVSLGTAVVAAFGCGSAFSAQDSPGDAATQLSNGAGGVSDAAAMVFVDAASPALDAAPSHDVLSSADVGMPGQLDGARDQAAEAQVPCAGTGGPPGVRVGAYCIDATEVTNRQYAVFLTQRDAHTDKQPVVCAWNTDYQPSQDWPVAVGRDNWPVGYVDWCDAYAFCQWAGKRMCGKIGGGANAFSDFDKASQSQWYRACSKGGALRYPYGQDLDSKACNVPGSGIDHAVNVKELPGCQGGYPGVYDMVGNVEEWEDACNDTSGALDQCRSRGLSYLYGPTDQGCALDDSDTRSGSFPDLGIRCCSD
jgi:formylglycine-generating enzyme required for sulfatase activity